MTSALLPPLGCAVTFGEPPIASEPVTLRINGDVTAYSGIRRLLGDLGSQRDDSNDFFGLTAEEAFEDAARRATTTNWWDIDRFESLVSKTVQTLEGITTGVVVVRGAHGADLPSLRVLLTAAIRLTRGAVRCLFVDVDTNTTITTLGHLARQAALAQMATSTSARYSLLPAHGHRLTAASDASAVREFLFRNDDVALASVTSGLDPLLLPILVALRMQRLDLAMVLIRELASSDDPIRRARAGSIRAVALSRAASPDQRAGAHEAIATGLRAIDGIDGEAAATERGWLYNAAGLAFVLDYRKSRDRSRLAAARAALMRALGEASGLTTGGGLALVQNATANAVRLLELDHRFEDAFALLTSTFPDVDEPALLYRRSVLQLRCGRHGAAMADLERATRTLRVAQWPFRIAILQAQAFGLERVGRRHDAVDQLLQAHAIAIGVRSRRCVGELAPSLIRLLGRIGSQFQAASLRDSLVTQGLDPTTMIDDGRPHAIDMPASKLPPYIAELDLYIASDARQGINKGFDELIGASAVGAR